MATFLVNGEQVELLEGESKTLANGKTFKLVHILFQDYAGGVRGATFCLK